MTDPRNALIWILGIVCAVLLGLVGLQAFALRDAEAVAKKHQDAYAVLEARLETQKAEAKTKLDQLTAERDQKQQELDRLHAEGEKRDASAQKEIARLGTELANRPIRVRIVAQSAGSGGGGGVAGASKAEGANAGDGDAAEAYGLLPEGNARRLGEVIREAETINAAYASCREALLSQ